jgi:hypothetical protein
MKRIALLLILLALIPSIALAASDVTDFDTLEIQSASCYGGLIETGDILCLVHFLIEYKTAGVDDLPEESASEAYLVQFRDTSDVPLRSVAPYEYVTSGYNNNAASIYFTAADVTSFGITWGAANSIAVTGNPSVFASPPSISSALVWVQQTEGGTDLGNAVTSLADTFETFTEWSAFDLVSCDNPSGCLLGASGEDYFTNIIPNLRIISPSIFAGGLLNPSVPVPIDYQYTYQTELQNTWQGTALEYTFSGLETFIPAPGPMVKGMFGLGVAVVVWAVVAKGLTGVNNGGLIAIFTVPVVLGVEAYMGIITLQIIAALIFVMLFIVAVWIVRR